MSKQPWGEARWNKARKKLPTWIVYNGKILDSLTPTSNVRHCKEPDDHQFFPDTSPSQTRSRTKAKKDLACCQKSDGLLSWLQKDDYDSSGTKGRPYLSVAKSGVIQLASKSGQNTTTESKGKRGSSNTNGKNKGAAIPADVRRLRSRYNKARPTLLHPGMSSRANKRTCSR